MAKKTGAPAPWERQKGETAKSFEHFCVYRDLGPSRSLREAAEIQGRARKTLEQVSVAHNWVERAAKWDEEQDRIARQEQINEIKKMRKRHAKLATDMLAKAAIALKTIPEDEIKASDVSRLIEIGSKLERISRGDSGDVVEERDGGQATVPPVQFYFPSNNRGDEEFEGPEETAKNK